MPKCIFSNRIFGGLDLKPPQRPKGKLLYRASPLCLGSQALKKKKTRSWKIQTLSVSNVVYWEDEEGPGEKNGPKGILLLLHLHAEESLGGFSENKLLGSAARGITAHQGTGSCCCLRYRYQSN